MPSPLDPHELAEPSSDSRVQQSAPLLTGSITGPVLRSYHERNLSPIERRWGLELIQPGDAWDAIPFNTYMAWRYRGELQAECLQRAVAQMEHRHAVLSCTLRHIDGGWRFVDAGGRCAAVAELAVTGPDFETDASRLVGEFVFRQFDLNNEGPLRVGFARIGAKDAIIGVVIHHAFTDRYSSRLFAQELSSIYDSLVRGQPPQLAEVKFSFLDYMHSVADWSTTPDAQPSFQYWQRYLEGAQPIAFRRAAALQGSSYRLSELLSDRVRELCAAEGVGIRMYWEAVHHAALFRLLGHEDVTTLSVDLGRRQAAYREIVGQFVNLLPCRSQLSSGLTGRQLIRQLHRASRESAPHRQLPYHLLDESCRLSLASSFGHLNFIPDKFKHLPAFGELFQPAIPRGISSRFIYPYVVSVAEERGFTISCGGHACQPFTMNELKMMLERMAVLLVTRPDSTILEPDIGLSDQDIDQRTSQ